MESQISRRGLLAGAALVAGAVEGRPAAAQDAALFRYCLNTSTLRGRNLSITRMVEIAGSAGYQGIEPWLRDIDDYVKAGGSLPDLASRIRDRGLTVESAIAFPEWIVDDDARRARGMEEARRTMELVRQLGGRRIAAPPAGATDRADLDLFRAAERYRVLCELGEQTGVVPQVEVWGFSKTLGQLSGAAFVAMQSGHPQACVLPDVYHLYRGGSDFEGLRLLNGAAMHAFHMNDYPAAPPREQLRDSHRVYPGDGVAPLPAILRTLRQTGFRGALSLELFNPDYEKQDPLQVAKTGLEKMRAAVRASLA